MSNDNPMFDLWPYFHPPPPVSRIGEMELIRRMYLEALLRPLGPNCVAEHRESPDAPDVPLQELEP